MKRTVIYLAPVVAAGPVLGHPGHIADVAGHDHWLAGAAIGAAVLIAGWGVLKDRAAKKAKKLREERARKLRA